jgi:RNA polymerase sigma-70 factor (ECF subfamily)
VDIAEHIEAIDWIDRPGSVAFDTSSSADRAQWFAAEVQPYESLLRAYLHHKFPTLGDVDDIVQDSYLRIIRAKIAGTLRSPKGFLFTAAKNAALDVFRRKRTVSLDQVVEPDGLSVFEDRPGVAETISRGQELDLLQKAIEALPPRCRQVLMLRKIDGLSHKEIARKMGISERTVNVQVGKGVQRCARYLREQGI